VAERDHGIKLPDQLIASEIAAQAGRAGGAKRTTNRTADLSRYAQRVAAVEHALDARAIGQTSTKASVVDADLLTL
jgi:hypothetical protein